MKKHVRMIAFLILSICLTSCSTADASTGPDIKQTSPVWEAPVNNNGNTNNGGNFFYSNGVLYGRLIPNFEGTGFFFLGEKFDDETKVLFDESDASNIVKYDNYLYFIDSADNVLYDFDRYYNGNLRRLDLETGESQIVVDAPVFCFYIYNDKIYYQVGRQKGQCFTTTINCVALDGENRETIYTISGNDFFTCPFSVYNDAIYFATENTGLVRISIDQDIQSKTEMVFSTKFSDIIRIVTLVPHENCVFFDGVSIESGLSHETSVSKLYKYDFESQQLTTVMDERIIGFTMDKDVLYCSTENGFYKLETSSMEKMFLFDDLFGQPEIVNDTLYFFVQHNHGATTYFENRPLP